MTKQTAMPLVIVATNNDLLTYHPLTEPWPLIKGPRFDALVASIKDHGLDHPIVLYERRILDGRNRWRACKAAGVPFRTIDFDGDDPVDFVLRSNLRRELNASQRAMVAAKLANRPEGRPSRTAQICAVSHDQAAASQSVSRRSVQYAAELLASGDFELIEAVEQGEIAVSAAVARLAMKVRRLEVAEQGKRISATGERYRLVQTSVTAMRDEPAASVDLVITDPPYPEEFIPLFGELAKGAAHVLKPGGMLLCMSGQSWLPKIYKAMDGWLPYLWTLCYLTPGGQATQVFPRRVNTSWKPVLVFVQGPYEDAWYGDVTRSDVNDNDKHHHHWGQSLSGMRDLMGRFVMPGHVVMDPFLGGGTTAVVALEMEASFIGFDIDPEALITTRARLADAQH